MPVSGAQSAVTRDRWRSRQLLLRSISRCVTWCGKARGGQTNALCDPLCYRVSPLNAYSKVALFAVNWINLGEARNRMPLGAATVAVTVAKPTRRTGILKSSPGLHQVSHQVHCKRLVNTLASSSFLFDVSLCKISLAFIANLFCHINFL